MNIDLKQIRELATKFILEQAAESLPGKRKMNRVIDAMIEDLDARWEPDKPFAEFLSDVALGLLRVILKDIAQEQFEVLRGEGRV